MTNALSDSVLFKLERSSTEGQSVGFSGRYGASSQSLTNSHPSPRNPSVSSTLPFFTDQDINNYRNIINDDNNKKYPENCIISIANQQKLLPTDVIISHTRRKKFNRNTVKGRIGTYAHLPYNCTEKADDNIESLITSSDSYITAECPWSGVSTDTTSDIEVHYGNRSSKNYNSNSNINGGILIERSGSTSSGGDGVEELRVFPTPSPAAGQNLPKNRGTAESCESYNNNRECLVSSSIDSDIYSPFRNSPVITPGKVHHYQEHTIIATKVNTSNRLNKEGYASLKTKINNFCRKKEVSNIRSNTTSIEGQVYINDSSNNNSFCSNINKSENGDDLMSFTDMSSIMSSSSHGPKLGQLGRTHQSELSSDEPSIKYLTQTPCNLIKRKITNDNHNNNLHPISFHEKSHFEESYTGGLSARSGGNSVIRESLKIESSSSEESLRDKQQELRNIENWEVVEEEDEKNQVSLKDYTTARKNGLDTSMGEDKYKDMDLSAWCLEIREEKQEITKMKGSPTIKKMEDTLVVGEKKKRGPVSRRLNLCARHPKAYKKNQTLPVSSLSRSSFDQESLDLTRLTSSSYSMDPSSPVGVSNNSTHVINIQRTFYLPQELPNSRNGIGRLRDSSLVTSSTARLSTVRSSSECIPPRSVSHGFKSCSGSRRGLQAKGDQGTRGKVISKSVPVTKTTTKAVAAPGKKRVMPYSPVEIYEGEPQESEDESLSLSLVPSLSMMSFDTELTMITTDENSITIENTQLAAGSEDSTPASPVSNSHYTQELKETKTRPSPRNQTVPSKIQTDGSPSEITKTTLFSPHVHETHYLNEDKNEDKETDYGDPTVTHPANSFSRSSAIITSSKKRKTSVESDTEVPVTSSGLLDPEITRDTTDQPFPLSNTVSNTVSDTFLEIYSPTNNNINMNAHMSSGAIDAIRRTSLVLNLQQQGIRENDMEIKHSYISTSHSEDHEQYIDVGYPRKNNHKRQEHGEGCLGDEVMSSVSNIHEYHTEQHPTNNADTETLPLDDINNNKKIGIDECLSTINIQCGTKVQTSKYKEISFDESYTVSATTASSANISLEQCKSISLVDTLEAGTDSNRIGYGDYYKQNSESSPFLRPNSSRSIESGLEPIAQHPSPQISPFPCDNQVITPHSRIKGCDRSGNQEPNEDIAVGYLSSLHTSRDSKARSAEGVVTPSNISQKPDLQGESVQATTSSHAKIDKSNVYDNVQSEEGRIHNDEIDALLPYPTPSNHTQVQQDETQQNESDVNGFDHADNEYVSGSDDAQTAVGFHTNVDTLEAGTDNNGIGYEDYYKQHPSPPSEPIAQHPSPQISPFPCDNQVKLKHVFGSNSHQFSSERKIVQYVVTVDECDDADEYVSGSEEAHSAFQDNTGFRGIFKNIGTDCVNKSVGSSVLCGSINEQDLYQYGNGNVSYEREIAINSHDIISNNDNPNRSNLLPCGIDISNSNTSKRSRSVVEPPSHERTSQVTPSSVQSEADSWCGTCVSRGNSWESIYCDESRVRNNNNNNIEDICTDRIECPGDYNGEPALSPYHSSVYTRTTGNYTAITKVIPLHKKEIKPTENVRVIRYPQNKFRDPTVVPVNVNKRVINKERLEEENIQPIIPTTCRKTTRKVHSVGHGTNVNKSNCDKYKINENKINNENDNNVVKEAAPSAIIRTSKREKMNISEKDMYQGSNRVSGIAEYPKLHRRLKSEYLRLVSLSDNNTACSPSTSYNNNSYNNNNSTAGVLRNRSINVSLDTPKSITHENTIVIVDSPSLYNISRDSHGALVQPTTPSAHKGGSINVAPCFIAWDTAVGSHPQHTGAYQETDKKKSKNDVSCVKNITELDNIDMSGDSDIYKGSTLFAESAQNRDLTLDISPIIPSKESPKSSSSTSHLSLSGPFHHSVQTLDTYGHDHDARRRNQELLRKRAAMECDRSAAVVNGSTLTISDQYKNKKAFLDREAYRANMTYETIANNSSGRSLHM